MKEFEKWYDKNKGSLFCPVLTHRSRSDCEKVWKAALEFVQSRFEFGSEVAYSTDDILMAVKKEIIEELEK